MPGIQHSKYLECILDMTGASYREAGAGVHNDKRRALHLVGHSISMQLLTYAARLH